MANLLDIQILKHLIFYAKIRWRACACLPRNIGVENHRKLKGFSKIIVTCIRNEDKYIRHWISYHIEIGFTCIYVYDNAYEDMQAKNTRELIKDFIENDNVVYIRWRDVKGVRIGTEKNTDRSRVSIQELAYFHFSSQLSRDLKGCAYIKLDVDEYIYDPNTLTVKDYIVNRSIRVWGYDFGGNSTNNVQGSVISRFTFRAREKTHFKQFNIAGESIWAPNAHFDYPGLLNRLTYFAKRENWFETSNLVLNHYRLKSYQEFLDRKVNIPHGYTKGDYKANEYALLNKKLCIVKDSRLISILKELKPSLLD